MSIEQKILTPYSGFIIIDQSLITSQNDDGEDDNDDDGNGDDGDLTGLAENNINSFDLELSAYPNPFNSTVTLKITLPEASNYKLIIFDILGQKVKEFDLSSFSEGKHYIKWFGETDDNDKVSSGFYFAVLIGDNIKKTIKLQLVE
jgi:hypothetical protein